MMKNGRGYGIVLAVLVYFLLIGVTGSAGAVATITPITFNHTVSFERPVVSGSHYCLAG